MSENTPTDDEREAVAQWLHLRFGQNPSLEWADVTERHKAAWRDVAADAPLRRSEEPSAPRPSPPVYLAADLWNALGAPALDFDAYYERNGWANTWSNLLGVVRDRFKLKCGQDAEGEPCVLTAGHLPPHYGASDVGSSEPVPTAALQAEPSDAQVAAAVNAYRVARNGWKHMNSDVHIQCMRAALLAAGVAK